MNSSIVESASTWGTVYLREGGSLTLSGTTLARNDGIMAMLIFAAAADPPCHVTAEDTIVSDNTAGNAVHLDLGALGSSTWTRCAFLRNQGDSRFGGAAALYFNFGTSTVVDSVFAENIKDDDIGGAVTIRSGATVTFERTTFNANTAREAAAVSVEGASTVQFLSSVFTANIGQQFGVVKVMGSSSVSLDDCELDANYMHSSNGGLYVGEASDVVVRHSKLSNQQAFSYAAGAHIAGTSTLTIEDSLVEGNTALFEAGFAWVSGGSTVTCTRVEFRSNTAFAEGGVFTVDGASMLKMVECWCVARMRFQHIPRFLKLPAAQVYRKCRGHNRGRAFLARQRNGDVHTLELRRQRRGHKRCCLHSQGTRHLIDRAGLHHR